MNEDMLDARTNGQAWHITKSMAARCAEGETRRVFSARLRGYHKHFSLDLVYGWCIMPILILYSYPTRKLWSILMLHRRLLRPVPARSSTLGKKHAGSFTEASPCFNAIAIWLRRRGLEIRVVNGNEALRDTAMATLMD